ncbi:MAG TPA: DNA/RNA non-specific endonuclease, partial [Enterococcus sp.]|nr:DNA/RNA non-specific endonuclease [Enterococcus sp.]
SNNYQVEVTQTTKAQNIANTDQIPAYSGEMVLQVNHNQPTFSKEDLSLKKGSWQTFSDLDRLNRVGVANAMLGKDLLPHEKRGDISKVYPTGWKQKKMSNGEFLYNRSHLIAHQLTGEDANWKNLFTGTELMNQEYMTIYEQQVASYVKNTGNHVRYQVKPIFVGDELICRGVEMQAKSIETDEISYHVFIYNAEKGYEINYLTGSAKKAS